MIVLSIFIVTMTIEIWLSFWFQDCLKSREFTYLLGMEISWFIENETITVAENIGREPAIQAETTGTDDRSETTLDKSLTCLEVLTGDRHLGLLCEFPHSRNINSCIRSTHDERSTFCQSSISVAHGWSYMLAVVSLHCSLKCCQCTMNLHIYRNVDFGRCCPDNNDTGTTVLLLEVADILTKSLYHLPACLAILHIVAIKTLCIVLVESSFHWYYLLQLLAYRVDIFLFQYLSIHSCLISILRINIPSTEYDIIKVSKWNDVLIVQIFLVCTLANTNLVVLSH